MLIYIWPDIYKVRLLDAVILTQSTLFFGMIFSIHFLRTKELLPRFHRVMQAIALASVFLIVSIVSPMVRLLPGGILTLNLVLNLIGCLLGGILAWRAGHTSARFYLLSWAPLFLVSVVLSLERDGVFPTNEITPVLGLLASLLEMVLLSFALADRINFLQRQTEASKEAALSIQKQLNQELELRVSERTQALEQALIIQQSQHSQLQERHRQLETTRDQLIAQARMASMAILSAGIAHELRNPLNFIQNGALISSEMVKELEDVLQHLDQPEDLETRLDSIVQDLAANVGLVNKNAVRAERIVQSMIDWSGNRPAVWHSMDFNKIVDQFVNITFHAMLTEQERAKIVCSKAFEPDLGQVYGLVQPIGRAISQLVTNAIEAVLARGEREPATWKPEIVITTRGDADSVTLIVADNGVGITPDILDQIYSPFFSTKRQGGQHLGLGLAMTYEIVARDHRGRLTAESQPGKFTRMTIILPRNLSRFTTNALSVDT